MIQFSCEKALLQSAISVASRAVAPKSSIPALEGLLLHAGKELTVSGYDEGFLNRIMVRLREVLITYLGDEFRDVPLVLYGPFEAPVYRVQNVYRMRFVLKCRLNKRTRAFFDRLLCEFGKPSSTLLRDSTGDAPRMPGWKDRQVHLSVDLNPTTI